MPNSSYFYCLPVFTLPEFPSECKIVKDNSLFLRDILCSYKRNSDYNPHIYWGGQYDPHYEYEPTPQHKMCHKNQRNRIKKLADSNLYDRIFIVFRSNRLFLDGSNGHYIIGYYEIDQNRILLDPDYEDYTLFSNNAVFVGIEQAIELTDFLKKTGMYISRFRSETHNGAYQTQFINYIDEMNGMDNRLNEYIDETVRIEKIFKYHEFEKGIYGVCSDCYKKDKCPLIKRVKKYKLHHNLPDKLSSIINDFYKTEYDLEGLI